ncbi:MAG: DNA cytosine methyltransferase [Oscillospiraceae bacterium]|nr:DNA cytosine methyltransferase [Oscillospiraceae bacterium]
MNVLELFGGIGAWSKALARLNIPHNLVGFFEIDKYAAQAYCAIHGEPISKCLGDIRYIEADKLPKVDVIFASPPCQSFSVAGKQSGMSDERGKLFLDTLRIIEQTKPKVCLIENVKGLTFKKFEAELAYILSYLDGLSYNVYTQILDAKDYGIPQSRKRVFFVCIRKDLDSGTFEFPAPQPLEFFLADLLEADVDEKYYISGKHLIYWNESRKRDYPIDKLSCIGYVNNIKSQGYRIYDNNMACCLSSGAGGMGGITGLYVQGDRVRKLTPLECMRLMAFDDADYENLRAIGISDAQLYKLCGNSIVVSVIEAIFKNLNSEGIVYEKN